MEAIEDGCVYTDRCESLTFRALHLEAHTVRTEVSCFEVNFYCKCQQSQKCCLTLQSSFDLSYYRDFCHEYLKEPCPLLRVACH